MKQLSSEFSTSEPSSPASYLDSIRPVGELIQYLCAAIVAEELHFTRAAARLRMDQSVVSRHVQKLEASLGARLFVRGDRRIEMTAAGEAFLPFARKALLAASAGVRVSQAIARGEPEEFEVAYSPFVDIHLVAQIKQLVETSRPAITVRLRSIAPEKVVERLLSGNSQVAIEILPVDQELASACIQREELFVVLPLRHRLQEHTNINVTEIGDDPIVWASGAGQTAFTKHVFALFRRRGYIPNVVQDAQTAAEALGLARAGLGLTFLKDSDRSLIGEGLVARPLSNPIYVETGLLYLPERRWDVLTRFVTMVTRRFQCGQTSPRQ